MTQPLDGVRVLDMSRHMTGPYLTAFLADYGADVIKVEPLPQGDPIRHIGTAFTKGESWQFQIWNRGKRSLAINTREPEGKEVLYRLAESCDVFVENYRPGVADNFGMGYERLSSINPRLIYLSLSAFGEGPLAAYPGTDPVVQAMSGVMSVTGEPDGGPLLVGIPVADFSGAMIGAQAVLLGLLARHQTGRGQKIDVSMLFGLLSGLTTRLASYWCDHQDPQRYGSAHSIVVPYQAFRTADGYAVAGVWGDKGWPDFCRIIGRPDLLEDSRFQTNRGRVDHRAELTAILDAVFVTRPTAEWEQLFHDGHGLFGAVYTFSQVLNHPHVLQAGIIQSVQHPVLGETPQLGPVIFLADTPGSIKGPAPMLGQHTRELLREAGYDETRIADLEARGLALTWEAGSVAA